VIIYGLYEEYLLLISSVNRRFLWTQDRLSTWNRQQRYCKVCLWIRYAFPL